MSLLSKSAFWHFLFNKYQICSLSRQLCCNVTWDVVNVQISYRGVNTFSPEGRLFQVEYAIEAIKVGITHITCSINTHPLLYLCHNWRFFYFWTFLLVGVHSHWHPDIRGCVSGGREKDYFSTDGAQQHWKDCGDWQSHW